jgi:hypothetical protein
MTKIILEMIEDTLKLMLQKFFKVIRDYYSYNASNLKVDDLKEMNIQPTKAHNNMK